VLFGRRRDGAFYVGVGDDEGTETEIRSFHHDVGAGYRTLTCRQNFLAAIIAASSPAEPPRRQPGLWRWMRATG
jgi:hypothetical protein